MHDASAAFDDNRITYWKPNRKDNIIFDSFYGQLLNHRTEKAQSLYARDGWLKIDLGKPETVKSIYLSEHILLNSKIKAFEVQYEKDGAWHKIAGSENMGEWKQNIEPVTSQKFRVVILEREGYAGINEFQLFSENIEI